MTYWRALLEIRVCLKSIMPGFAIRTYVRYARVRCPIHRRQEPEDEQHPVFPVAIRRTIADKVDEGICGQPLEGSPNED